MLAQQRVHNPAAFDVWTWPTTMPENLVVVAAAFYQCISKDGHALEAWSM
jgi:hypothetical protein